MKELQDFLRGHEVKFDTEPPKAQLDAARQSAAAEKEPPEGKQHFLLGRKLLIGMRTTNMIKFAF